jgi:acyl dehydratase
VSQRYFEDLSVGDELPPEEKLPTAELAAAFFTREGEPPPTPERVPVPRAGFEGTLVPGLLKVAWLEQYVVRWAGPEATFRMIRVAYRRPDTTGQPLTLTGRIVDKREEGGRKLLDVEVATIAEEGPSVRGMVTVELPSRR